MFEQLHMCAHNNPREGARGQFICKHSYRGCPKRFTKLYYLKNHHDMHDNVLYRCQFCPWTGVASERINITRHFNAHYRIRDFPCSLCDASFYTKPERDRHEEHVHRKISRFYKCGGCDYESTIYVAYRDHIEYCESRNPKIIEL